MQAGVLVSDECVTKFNDLKLKHSLRFIVYRMSDDLKSVIIEREGERGASYSDFTAALPDNDCRYGVYDYEYETEGGPRSKIVFFIWAPDGSKIKSKMVYAATKDDLKKRFVGIGTEIQACDRSEVDARAVLDKCKAI